MYTYLCKHLLEKKNFLLGSLLIIIVAQDMFYLEDYYIQLYYICTLLW